jgi:hypothetical protein
MPAVRRYLFAPGNKRIDVYLRQGSLQISWCRLKLSLPSSPSLACACGNLKLVFLRRWGRISRSIRGITRREGGLRGGGHLRKTGLCVGRIYHWSYVPSVQQQPNGMIILRRPPHHKRKCIVFGVRRDATVNGAIVSCSVIERPSR